MLSWVSSLQFELTTLSYIQEQKKMRRDLEDEQSARKKLEGNIKKALKNRTDIVWEENLT